MSAAATINANVAPVKPSLRDALDIIKRETFLDLNCHHVGTIQSFDPVRQVAQVSIVYTKTYNEPDSSGVFQLVEVEYPLLIDVPVIILGGSAAYLSMPIAQGDDCLVLFNDRDIDVWFSGNYDQPCSTARLHNISDGFALVGIRAKGDWITLYDGSRAVLQNGPNARVAVSTSAATLEAGPASAPTVQIKADQASGKVLITNATSLGTILQSLSSDLKSLCSEVSSLITALNTTGSVAGVCPSGGGALTGGSVLSSSTSSIASALSSLNTSIGNVGTQLGGLLL